jgi:pimeloyl-ACP methyl ester carboxylesterase
MTPLFLLPGLLCDDAVWKHQLAALRSRAACFVPDYGTTSSIAAMAKGVLDNAPSKFALVGHSMGARVALEIVRNAPARVARLALLDTGLDPLPSGEAGERERAQRLALLSMARNDGMRAMGAQWARGMVHPDHVEAPLFGAILDMIGRKTPQIFEAQINALLGRPDARAVLAGIEVPTLLACGRQDAWSPLARHEQMHAMLRGSTLVVIEHSGHMTPMEQPAAVTAALMAWLEGGSLNGSA